MDTHLIFVLAVEVIALLSNQRTLVLLRNCTNVLEAASKGAASSVGLISATIVNIISFLALLTFFNAVLSWLGGMFGCPELSFAV